MKINVEYITPAEAKDILIKARLSKQSKPKADTLTNASEFVSQNIEESFNIKPNSTAQQLSLLDNHGVPLTERKFYNLVGEIKPFPDLTTEEQAFYFSAYAKPVVPSQEKLTPKHPDDRAYPLKGQLDLFGGVSDGLERMRQEYPTNQTKARSLNEMSSKERENFFDTYKAPIDYNETHTSILNTVFLNNSGQPMKFKNLTDEEQSIVLDSLTNDYTE